MKTCNRAIMLRPSLREMSVNSDFKVETSKIYAYLLFYVFLNAARMRLFVTTECCCKKFNGILKTQNCIRRTGFI